MTPKGTLTNPYENDVQCLGATRFRDLQIKKPSRDQAVYGPRWKEVRMGSTTLHEGFHALRTTLGLEE